MSNVKLVVYAQCGLRLRSEVKLDLPLSIGDGWDVDIRWGEDILDSRPPPPGETIAIFETGRNTWYTATSTESGYHLRFRDCGEFLISEDLSEVQVRRDPWGRTELLPILIAGTVSAFLLALGGNTVLHASAVAIDGSALAFVGQSGRGKSTLAALMCVAGAELVTDDVLVVDDGRPVMCIGGASELRLREKAFGIAQEREDSEIRMTADERLAFAPTLASSGLLPLAAIVIPSPSQEVSEVEIRCFPPSEALFALLTYPRIHGWTHPEILSREFSTLSQIVNEIPVYDVTIPWGPPFSPDIARALTSLMTSESGVFRSASEAQ